VRNESTVLQDGLFLASEEDLQLIKENKETN